MEDLNVVIAGAAGEGIQTVGAVLTATILAQGYAVFAWQEYESRIRGGQKLTVTDETERRHCDGTERITNRKESTYGLCR